jgi:hypothetical protein
LRGGLVLKNAKKLIALFIVFAICFSFCGCRTRLSKSGTNETTSSAKSDDLANTKEDNIETSNDINSSENITPLESKKSDNTNNQNVKSTFKENKTAVQSKKKSDNAIQVVKQSDDTKGNGGTNSVNPSDDNSGNLNSDNVDDDSNRNDLTEKDEQEQETPMHTAINKYEQLMSSNNAELYDCQKLNVYFELEDDYKSVTRDDEKHKLITDAGGYNIAEIKYSAIDSQWVVGKNPDIIVKVVPSSILGSGVESTSNAQIIKNEIISRLDWDNVSAVQNGKILLLSSELFETQAGKITAELYMAKAMYDAIYSDFDIDSAYEEMTGTTLDGIYAY